ncbi:neurotrimin-like isoform X1 [Odontomachus brunneus]|uniref:neurotrimin-like isoform X1 n=1 Tax=Odontomachus brunneus TaxID=486640 RepID=UPI0013F1F83B|nr:neurotrimin-like isoform X1 [Odontomachus brunneus]
MAPFLLILPLLASLRQLIQPIDCAIDRGGPTKQSDVGAYLRPKSVKDVLAQTGGNALLPCRFNGPGIVTWIRRKDRQLLTVGWGTHSIDQRFVVVPDWSLLIKNVKHEDAGLYECQIQTEPVQQRFVWLNITEAYSMIPGGPDLHVKQGSSLRLECQLMAAAESPSYIFWYRENRMINYDNEPGVKVERTRNGSVLIVEKMKLTHGANYTCLPSNAKPAYIMIHVIEEEEKPAAMHGGDRRNSKAASPSHDLLAFIILTFASQLRHFLYVIRHVT